MSILFLNNKFSLSIPVKPMDSEKSISCSPKCLSKIEVKKRTATDEWLSIYNFKTSPRTVNL